MSLFLVEYIVYADGNYHDDYLMIYRNTIKGIKDIAKQQLALLYGVPINTVEIYSVFKKVKK
jgi:hypothetical protein